MKPILILDNGPDDRVDTRCDLSLWADDGLVEFAVQAPEERITPDAYGTVFVHNGNEDEVEWAREAFDPTPIFVFSGAWVDRPTPVGNEVYFPRQEFLDRLSSALSRYRRTGGAVTPDLFDAGVAAHAGTTVAQGRSISFSGDLETHGPLVFPIIRRDDGTVDYVSTLAPLATLEEVLPITIDERYGGDGGGVELLRRLRMGSFLGGEFARWPVEFRLTSTIAHLLESDPAAAVVLTPGVSLDGSGGKAVQPLMPETLLRVLETLPVAPGSRSSRHSVANRWGPVRLRLGHHLLRGEDEAAVAWTELGRELLRDEEYWHLLSVGVLRRQVGPSVSTVPTGERRADGLGPWRRFLNGHAAERPLRVLYVDDEGHLGWFDAVKDLFSEVEGAAEVVCYPEGEDVDEGALNRLARQRWDLVLCDLRLRPSDQTLGIADPKRRREYSGIDFIRAVKGADGHAPTPAIAFTASNKSWTYAAVHEAGGTGFWVKEGPEQGASSDYSRQNAAELLTAIREAVAFRDRRRFLWEMIENLRRERGRLVEWFSRLHAPVEKGTLSGLAQLGALKENLGVTDRLDQIEALWLRAYGYLQARPSPFERDAYEFAPEDVAFLHLYGSLNQIRALRYRLGSEDAAMLQSGGKVEALVDGATWSTWGDSLRKQVSVGKKMKAAQPWEEGGDHFDALYSGMLLVESGRKDLDRLLNGMLKRRKGKKPIKVDGLRDLRNDLDIIHSDVAHADDQAHADIDEHLRPMCEVLRCALLLDIAG